jgi:glutamate-ammonia-ligase adenylyltransferase
LEEQTNILSDKFILSLRQATTGGLPVETFEKVISAFEKELKEFYFSPVIEANLYRMIFSLYDKVSFLMDCLRYPYHIQIILSIAVNSNFLTDVVVRNPEFLYWVLNSDVLNQEITKEYIKNEIEQGFKRFKTFNAKINYLRTLKRRELLRIGLNDILGNYDLKHTTILISIIAKGINAELFNLCHNEISVKYGISIENPRYCLCALGKLGGDELNYSSDIDLILFFDNNSTVRQDPPLEYFELINEATFLFIQQSTAKTERGYLYRVDFRLRPDGRNSPLCRTLRDYIQYYETRGEDWERQMLIKLSFVGGNRELFETFNNYIQHFIYPSSFSVSPVNQITRIKNDIEKKIGETDNVKLFSGGIRDIEFSLQALQLLNGGKIKNLRTGNSLTAIENLQKEKLLSEDESVILTESYIFYRKIEHFLQLMNDKQTHLIPEDHETLTRLARFLGFNDVKYFQDKVERTRNKVRDIYNSVVGKSESKDSDLGNVQFADIKKSSGNFKYLQTGQGLLEQKQFDKQAINAFKNIEPILLDFLINSITPDTVLENFSRVIKTVGLPSIWYNEFEDNFLFNSFLKICELNKKAVEMMHLDKTLGDLLLSRRALTERFENSDNYSISQVIFILSIQYCLGILEQEKLSKILSYSVLSKIQKICDTLPLPPDYLIIGLGSFGSDELTFNSDIDLVFIVKDLIRYPEAQNEFQKLFITLKKQLKPFDVDSRLRPEGKSSPLVWDLQTYFEYLDKRAQSWEMQALTRIRLVKGDNDLFNNFLKKIKERTERLEKDNLIKEITAMRIKMEKQLLSTSQAQFKNFFNIKRSRGGLTDIEFILQYHILRNPENFFTLIGQSSIEIIKRLIKTSEKFIHLEILIPNYEFLKKLELWNQILFDTKSKVIPLDDFKRKIIARILHFKDVMDFETGLVKIISANRSFFEKTFSG